MQKVDQVLAPVDAQLAVRVAQVVVDRPVAISRLLDPRGGRSPARAA
jgi:hypothetical protein